MSGSRMQTFGWNQQSLVYVGGYKLERCAVSSLDPAHPHGHAVAGPAAPRQPNAHRAAPTPTPTRPGQGASGTAHSHARRRPHMVCGGWWVAVMSMSI